MCASEICWQLLESDQRCDLPVMSALNPVGSLASSHWGRNGMCAPKPATGRPGVS